MKASVFWMATELRLLAMTRGVVYNCIPPSWGALEEDVGPSRKKLTLQVERV
jgi:hypothetical protein